MPVLSLNNHFPEHQSIAVPANISSETTVYFFFKFVTEQSMLAHNLRVII